MLIQSLLGPPVNPHVAVLSPDHSKELGQDRPVRGQFEVVVARSCDNTLTDLESNGDFADTAIAHGVRRGSR